jgi:hypothetical protein
VSGTNAMVAPVDLKALTIPPTIFDRRAAASAATHPRERASLAKLDVTCGRRRTRRNSSHALRMLRRRVGESVLLLMVGTRRELLCVTDSGPKAHKGDKHRGPRQKAPDPDISESLLPSSNTLGSETRCHSQSACPKRTPLAYEWIFRSFGH